MRYLKIEHRDTKTHRFYFKHFKKLCASVPLCLIHFFKLFREIRA